MAAALNEQHRQLIDAFPYPPYEIQQQLMVNVYEALQHRRIGLFESPTGDGLPGTESPGSLLLVLL